MTSTPFQTFAPLLFPAARAYCRPEHLQRLTQIWSNMAGWQGLVEFAEEQGLAPLFDRHAREAGLELPAALRIQFQGLTLRHRLANQQRAAQLGEILAACRSIGIDLVLLKGAALFDLVYPDPALRPMRDMDLLTRPGQALKLYNLLQELGYSAAPAGEPFNLHHLPPLYKRTDGLQSSLEVHYNLFGPAWHARPPGIDEWIDRARPFDFQGQTAYTLRLEDMLWHVYQHAINGPLRLVSLADLVSVAEHFVDQIDWEMIRGAYPALLAVLALIHAQAPLGDRLLGCAEITARSRAIRLGDGCQGWPVKSLAEGRAMGYVRFLQATFMPSDWLLALYYGIKNEQMIPLFRWIIHPFELGRIALYRLWLRPQRKKLSGNVSRTD